MAFYIFVTVLSNLNFFVFPTKTKKKETKMFIFEVRLNNYLHVKQIIVNFILTLLMVTVFYLYAKDYEKIKNLQWTTKMMSVSIQKSSVKFLNGF